MSSEYREAFQEIVDICDGKKDVGDKLLAIYNLAYHALALPRRNCDVGTAEEQGKRFSGFCHGRICCYCPVRKTYNEDYSGVICAIKFSQMPYEEIKNED